MPKEANGYVRVPAEELKAIVASILTKYDVPPDHAAIVSDVLVAADLRGIESHGVNRLVNYYISRLEGGHMKPRPNIRFEKETPTSFIVDADNGLGHAPCHIAMEKCIEKAKTMGIAMGGIKNSTHFGIAGYYAMMALDHGLIGMCLTNSGPYMVPTYGRQKMLGTNPISIAVPAGKRRPFVLDMATTVVPMGRVQLHHRKEMKVSSIWGVDGRGQPTEDPKDIIGDGGLNPLGGSAETGGYKGYGLAAVVDILTGAFIGSPFLTSIGTTDKPGTTGVGHFVAAFKADAFMDMEEFLKRMDDFIDELKNAPLAEGCDTVYIAGEKEYAAHDENSRLGVPVNRLAWADIVDLCERFGIEMRESLKKA